MNSLRYSIVVVHAATHHAVPWAAELRDSDIRAEHPWAMRYLGGSVESAILGLAAMAERSFHWAPDITEELIRQATVEMSHVERSLGVFGRASTPSPADYCYSNPMNDENDRNVTGPGPGRVKRCEKCNIGSDKYANGDATNISDRPDRFLVMRKFCYLCGLQEAVEQLRNKYNLTPRGEGTPPAGQSSASILDFDGWLRPGDLMRAAALGVKLDGELPNVTETQRSSFAFEYGRSY